MKPDRLFVDTAFIQAIFNRSDQYHSAALKLLPRMRSASELWITEAVLLEIGNALSVLNRTLAADFIRQCYSTPNVRLVPATTSLLMRGLDLFDQRKDKTWSLTDCISFVVMADQNLLEALTSDHHFEQAGFVCLLK